MSDKTPIRVLMVDDEEEFLGATVRALTRRGFEVVPASTPVAALAEAERGTFDVVLLDLKMPGIDGLELYRRLRRKDPGLPAIVLTGHGSEDLAFDCAREEVFGYLTKPCEIDYLAERLEGAALAERVGEVGGLSISDRIRVLLVDDETELLDTLAKVLGRRKMKVYTATDGHSALKLVGEVVLDVVVLDVKMPGMDGLEVLRRIKEANPTVEVLLLTGHPTVRAAMDGMRHGARDYLVKPPDIGELVERIRECWAHRRRSVEKLREDSIWSIWRRYPI